jgi:predicted nucleic acid-binding protein
MNLTLDANILLDELTREGGLSHSLLTHRSLGTLYIAEFTWDEAIYVLDNRINNWVRRGRLTMSEGERFSEIAKIFAGFRCTMVSESFYKDFENEARRRIPDDPDDWHTAALALTTETAIWTLDQKHFFGCGIAVWKTNVLRTELASS